MNNLDFVFSLFGVVLALCLAEVLTGAARAARQRRDAILEGRDDVKLGLLTPLLAVFLLFDITSFWAVAWALREAIPANYQVLIFGLFATSLYYVAASWTFPQSSVGSLNLDEYYLKHKAIIFSLVFTANVVTYFGRAWVLGTVGMPGATTYDYALLISYYVLQFAGIWVRGRRANLVILAGLVLGYAESTFGLALHLIHGTL